MTPASPVGRMEQIEETDARKPKVYVFINGGEAGWLNARALAEDGTVLAAHTSSDENFARLDMGVFSGHDWCGRGKTYTAHYPDGYEIVDLIDIGYAGQCEHPEFMAAVARSKAKSGAERATDLAAADMPRIEVTFADAALSGSPVERHGGSGTNG